MNSEVHAENVVSADGTTIGYLRQGSGDTVVLVQGGMADVYAYSSLARELSSSFTVVTAERRGRGVSPRPYSPDHDLARDVEDVDAVMAATGATRLFGLSSGAVIALEATRTLDRVERLALYEPPFYPNGIDHDGIRRLNAEIERGHFGAALVDALITARTAPAVIARLPRPVSRALARIVLAVQSRQPGPASSLRSLLPGVRYDFNDVASVQGRMNTFASIYCPVLLLSGTKSPAFLRTAVVDLGNVLRDSEHVEFSGLGHDGPWNDGNPTEVATALSSFFHASARHS